MKKEFLKSVTSITDLFSTKKELKKTLLCIFVVCVSTVIYCLGVMWFLEPAELYSGGVTGLAQLLSNACYRFFGFKLNLGLVVFLINVPILIYGWTGVSKRFVICSIISIGLQTLLLSGIIPVVDFTINTGINPITHTVIGQADHQMDLLLLAFIGGFVSGFGAALSLRYGTSTGGIDVLAQAVAFKKNISIGYTSLIVNIIIAILGAFLFGNPAIAFYTMVRIIVQSVVTDKVHTAYNYLKVEIVTTKGDEISQDLIKAVGRGITLIRATGAYTHTDKMVLETVVSSYELQSVIEDAKKIDSHVFISVTPIKSVFGNFKRKTIA